MRGEKREKGEGGMEDDLVEVNEEAESAGVVP